MGLLARPTARRGPVWLLLGGHREDAKKIDGHFSKADARTAARQAVQWHARGHEYTIAEPEWNEVGRFWDVMARIRPAERRYL